MEKGLVFKISPVENRDILTVTPDGYFIRGADVTDEDYLEALDIWDKLGMEWRDGKWVKA